MLQKFYPLILFKTTSKAMLILQPIVDI